MVLGTFLTPTFVLSFSGGVVSALVMVLLYRLSRGGGPFRFSLIGISVGGAVSHILTQVALVYLLFVRSSGVLLLWPWLAFAAVVTGVITGLIAVQAVRRLDAGEASGATAVPLPVEERDEGDVRDECDRKGRRRLRPEAKIAAVMVIGLAVVIFSSYALYAAVLLLLAVITALARVRLSRLLVGLRRIWVLLVAALVMPVVFSPWGSVLFGIGPVRVTDQGLHEGAVFAARILLLFFATALLAQTTAPHEMAGGLEKLLAPLRVFRVRPGRLARSLSLSWSYFPQFWQSVRRMVGESRGRKGWLDRTIHLPGDIVADMYFLADQTAARVAQDVTP
jgi:energy-coupling factor transporter transmembrane protein EcfT